MARKKPGYNRQDNSAFEQKVLIRRHALSLVEQQVIMETHGGTGALYTKLYRRLMEGVVFEKHPDKTEILARQRPSWAVYEADCIQALRAGAGAHLAVNYLDVDPHGISIEVVDAFLNSARPKVGRLVLVGTDGGRMRVRFQSAWCTAAFTEIVAEFGNSFHDCYLDALEWYIRRRAAVAGYTVEQFGGTYSGHLHDVALYMAVLAHD